MRQLELFPIGAIEGTKSASNKTSIRSPLFYVGDKYKLMPQLKELFPKDIQTYYDVFCGGGSASINVRARKYVMNDIDSKIVDLHHYLQNESKDIDLFIKNMHLLIKNYGLSLSELGKNPEIEVLKSKFKKTYFAKYNRISYLKLRNDYNRDQTDIRLLYLLLIYGFNHMIRFNSQGKFNLPVGNVDWNKNVSTALRNYADWYNKNEVKISKSQDFEEFVESQNFKKGDFLYFDPPYLITYSDYNKLWSDKDEYRLYLLLDRLNKKGVHWGLSNMLSHKDRTNQILLNWARKYREFKIESNYISRFDNTIKKKSQEIYVTNFFKKR